MENVINLPIRPRRLRMNSIMRAMVAETTLNSSNLVYPLFVHDLDVDEEIDSMLGYKRWSIKGVLKEIDDAKSYGINSFVFFPKIDVNLKDPKASESFNNKGLIPRIIRKVRKLHSDILIITDVALDPYNIDGHDGILQKDKNGIVDIANDITVNTLCKQALCHAQAGADIISPSDMMDGRVAEIRKILDQNGFNQVSILSYAVKYASSFYGPFRCALGSAPKSFDKKTYQMDPANKKEAIRESLIDIQEGADIIMVKPAGYYLDIINELHKISTIPIAAYQVSGEYLMLKSAIKEGWINEEEAIKESLISIKRSGANIIFTYFAKDVAKCLSK